MQAAAHLVLFQPTQNAAENEQGNVTVAANASFEADFAAVVERNATFLYRVAHSLLRNAHDAEDAVQECLLKVHRIGAWRGIREERAFLARACWRSALDRLPRKDIDFTPADEQELFDRAHSPEDAAIEHARAARLHRLIDGLPLELREPLLLSGFEELNSREIAEVLRIPEGTVRTRLKRAREELRRRWTASELIRPDLTAQIRKGGPR